MRILIADDEAGARAKVKRFLETYSECEWVGEASNGLQAAELIAEHQPDLVFLDINMPHMNGFEVLQHIQGPKRPLIIFATAYSDRAIQAFEVNAVDYLLKPFDRQRFDAALLRAKQHLTHRDREDGYQRILRALTAVVPPLEYPQQIMVQGDHAAKVIACEAIDFVESAGNYTVLHVGKTRHIMRKTLRYLETTLDPTLFCRIHRQYLVRVHAIAEIQPYHKGDMMVVLHGGQSLKMSRRYKDDLLNRMAR